ncbi:MAG: long-chain fatty acid--CoA ligase [Pseudobdellovibrionaceae bacterium]
MPTSKVKTICDYVLEMPSRGDSVTALKSKVGGQWREFSWTDYFDQVSETASALLSVGVKPGDRVAIMSGTRLEWSVCDYAIMGIKAVTVPLYQTVTGEDLIHILSNSASKVLFVENRQLLKQFFSVRDKCPSIEKVVCFEPVRETDLEVMTWNDFYALGKQERPERQSEFESLCGSTELQDMATIIYTSGTTGTPKGVVITHEQILSEVSEAFPYVGATSEDISLSFLPYAHVLGRIEHWGHVFIGFQMAYAESIEKVRLNLPEIKPTIMISVPRIFEKVYSTIYAQLGNNAFRKKAFQWALEVGLKVGEHRLNRQPISVQLFVEYQLAQKLVLNKVREAFGGRLRFAISGGAPISKEIELFFHACGILILEGYGLSETTAAICVNTPFNYRFGSVGKPVGETQIRIAEDGEILVKSKKVMREYYQDPVATEAVMSDGWFHTGDIGEFLPSGDLRITDRKKDLIKTAGGKYVAPQKLENLLKLDSIVSQVLIHGDNKKYIVALLTLDPTGLKNFAEEKNLSYQDKSSLAQHPLVLERVRKAVAETNTQLASYETIKRFSILNQEFTVENGELTPSLKVKRKFLDQKFKKQLDALYS